MMATAAQTEPRKALPVNLPSGIGDDKHTTVGREYVTPVQFVELNDDGTSVVTELGDLPIGSSAVYTQRRLCGDFYCFIDGRRQVSATGDTLVDAFRNALALVEQSA